MSISKSEPGRSGSQGRKPDKRAGQGRKASAPLPAAAEPQSVTRQSPGLRAFTQGPDALYCWTSQEGSDQGKSYSILAGHLTVSHVSQLRDLGTDRTPGDAEDTLYRVRYEPRPSLIFDTLVSATDRDSLHPEWPDRTGVRGFTVKRRLAAIGEAITVMGQTAPRAEAYTCAGPVRLADGGLAFLRPGKPALTATGTDPARTCHYPDGIARQPGAMALDIDDPSGPETAEPDLFALLRLLDLTPGQPEIALALACLLAWAPFSALPELGRAVALVAGETGAHKTAMAGALIAAQSSTFTGGPGIVDPVTIKMRHNQSTVFGTDKMLYPLSGLVAVIDDLFADQMTERKLAETWERLSAIADNAATGSGGTRGGYRNGKGILAAGAYPRSSLLATAERLPGEDRHVSATARLAVLALDSPVSLPALSEVQASARAMSRAHAAMISASLPDASRNREALAWGQQEARSWKIDGHSRTVYGYARLLAGAHLIGARLADFEHDPAPFLKDSADLLRKAATDQARRSGIRNGRDMAQDSVRLFARYLREALGSGAVWLAAPKMRGRDYLPPDIPGHGPHAVGWRQTAGELSGMVPPAGAPAGAVFVREPGSAGKPPWRPVTARMRPAEWQRVFDAVARLALAASGFPLADFREMTHRLAGSGYLKSPASESTDLFNDQREMCYVLDLGRVLAGEDDPGGSQPKPEPEPDGSEPEPGPQDSAQGTLAGLDPAGHHTSTFPDPSPEPPGAAKPCPGPCRGCGSVWEYGKGGWLCPACRAKPDELASQADTVPGRARRSRRTQRDQHPYAVLGTDGLWTAGQDQAQACELPASLADAYALASARGIRQLWITPDAAAALGLPALGQLPDAALGSGHPHPWAGLPEGLKADPAGLACWLAVWDADAGRSASGRSAVLPHLETRAAWDSAPDSRTLLDAVTLLADALPPGSDYYMSPNVTTAQLARKLCRSLRPCAAIIGSEVPPAVHHRLMIPLHWSRELDAAERGQAGIARLDRNAAYLSSMATPLGIGEPERVAGPVTFRKELAGYYRLASQPAGFSPALPPLEVMPHDDGGLWVTRPDAELLADLGLLPDIAEAWIWPESGRALNPVYNALRKARAALYPAKGTPAGRIAWAVLGSMFHSFTGNLAKTRGPNGPGDSLYRPDYRDHLTAEASGRMYRNLLAAFRESGRAPVAVHVDAAYYPASGPADLPDGLAYDGLRGGAWKLEGYVPMADIDPAELHTSFDDALERINGNA
jgi:hypothetical protein